MKELYPMKQIPVFRESIWGGARLRELFGKAIPSDRTGESWEVSAHVAGPSSCANGACAGMRLDELCRRFGEDVWGARTAGLGRFPLLFKLIDAQDDLSVQVHPDDAYAAAHEAGQSGKFEMWYIIAAKPGSSLVMGLDKSLDRREAERLLAEGRFEQALHFVQVRPGEAYFIPAGRIHAIGGGIVLAEIQQNSDLTYRLYDYGRRDAQGRTRPLQTEKALDVADLSAVSGEGACLPLSANMEWGRRDVLAACRHFALEKIVFSGRLGNNTRGLTPHILFFLEGYGRILWNDGEEPFKGGDSFLVPAGAPAYALEGSGTFLLSYVPDFERDICGALQEAGYPRREAEALWRDVRLEGRG